MTRPRWSRAQASSSPYLRAVHSKKGQPFVLRPPSSCFFRKRELSMGVRVKLMSMETRMEKAMVQPNSLT